MRSNLDLGRVMLGAGALALVSTLALPAMAQSGGTPITDEYGATGTSPDASAWLEAINEQYGLPTETPVTDQYSITQEPNVSVWVEAIRSEYDVAEHPTPVSDEYGATGTSPDSAAWYERMKEEYGIGTSM